MDKFKVYVKSILIPVIVGGIVGVIVSRFIDYQELIKPFLAPPAALFPIVWTILYILMGVSYGILKNAGLADENVDLIYYLQLGVNALWSIFFFVFDWKLFSFFWILLLILLAIAMIIRFECRNRLSGLLQIPYLLWLVFAAYLNLSIYLLNR